MKETVVPKVKCKLTRDESNESYKDQIVYNQFSNRVPDWVYANVTF